MLKQAVLRRISHCKTLTTYTIRCVSTKVGLQARLGLAVSRARVEQPYKVQAECSIRQWIHQPGCSVVRELLNHRSNEPETCLHSKHLPDNSDKVIWLIHIQRCDTWEGKPPVSGG